MKNKLTIIIVSAILVLAITYVGFYFTEKREKVGNFVKPEESVEVIAKAGRDKQKQKAKELDDVLFVSNEATPERNKQKIFDVVDSNNLPVLIYSEEIGHYETSHGNYPRLAVWRKVGNDEDEKLVEVGNVNEYPTSVRLSPDNKFLLINLKSKLQIFDLQTKEQKDFFIPKKEVYSYIFSKDMSHLLVWDQIYGLSDEEYYIHDVNFQTGEDKILKHDNMDGIAFFQGWRNDGKIMLGFPSGEVAGLGYYDLNTNEVVSLSDRQAIFGSRISENGEFEIRVNSGTENICNDFSGSASDGFDIVESISADEIGSVGVKGKLGNVKISPDNKQILYIAEEIANTKAECNNFDPKIDYYYSDITGKNFKKISKNKASELLEEWYGDIGATQNYTDDKIEILINDKIVVSSARESDIRIVGQYYLKK